MSDLLIYDTTLRDGCQGEDVSFSLEDKIRIAEELAELQRIARNTDGIPRLVESVQTGVEVHHTGDLRVTGDGGGPAFSRSLLERVNEGLGIETERDRLHDGLVF